LYLQEKHELLLYALARKARIAPVCIGEDKVISSNARYIDKERVIPFAGKFMVETSLKKLEEL
jgi:hypothetical protein